MEKAIDSLGPACVNVRPRLHEALAAYWDAAYAEGQENRLHDTEDGAAQRALADVNAAVAEMVGAERERCRLAAHDAVMRSLDEAGVRNDVLRGMCAEVAMERFADELEA